MWETLLPVFGFLIGTVASLTGIGGGALTVPLLVLLFAFEPANAAGTSLAAIIFTASAAALNYARQRRIYARTGLVLAATTVPGALLGAFLTTIIPARYLGLIFGFFLIFIAVRIIISTSIFKRKSSAESGQNRKKIAKSDIELFKDRKTIMLGAGLSFFGGLSSGLLGIGGGVLMVPIMNLAMNMPIHSAIATSMFTMIFTSTSGVTQHYLANHIRFEYSLLLALGTVIGAQVGAYTSKRISSNNLRIIFAIVLAAISIQMILKFV